VKKELAEVLSSYCEGEIREEYSGRGMCGQTTAGFVVPDIGKFISDFLSSASAIGEDAEGIKIGHIRMDSMGQETIIY
jgi:hypothetical protein